MSKFQSMAGESLTAEAAAPEIEAACTIPSWLQIVDDKEHPGDQDYFILRGDFNISSMPDAIDHEIEDRCCIEKLFAIYVNDLVMCQDGSEMNEVRKIQKLMRVHKSPMVSRQQCVKMMVPLLQHQRDLMLGFYVEPVIEPPPVIVVRPPEPDTSHLYCLFY